jgi:uncharacterized protein (TIGR00251 family)
MDGTQKIIETNGLFYLDNKKNYIVFYIKVSTGSKENKILNIINHDNKKILKISIKERPIEGIANQAIIRFLSDILEIPQSYFRIDSGTKSKIKRINIINEDLNLRDIDKIISLLISKIMKKT